MRTTCEAKRTPSWDSIAMRPELDSLVSLDTLLRLAEACDPLLAGRLPPLLRSINAIASGMRNTG